jgi:hypothetical protein
MDEMFKKQCNVFGAQTTSILKEVLQQADYLGCLFSNLVDE